MPALTALASGSRLLACRSVLGSGSSPATKAISNMRVLGARSITSSPASKIEWEPQLAQLIDRLPLTDVKTVIYDKHLIDQARRLYSELNMYEAVALELQYIALNCESEILAILKENKDVVKWDHGSQESPKESDVEGKWSKVVDKMKLLAKTRDKEIEIFQPSEKDVKEQDVLTDDEATIDVASAMHVLEKRLKTLESIEMQTMESRKILHEGIQGFGKILGIDIEPAKAKSITKTKSSRSPISSYATPPYKATRKSENSKRPMHWYESIPDKSPENSIKYEDYKDWRDDQGDSWHQAVS